MRKKILAVLVAFFTLTGSITALAADSTTVSVPNPVYTAGMERLSKCKNLTIKRFTTDYTAGTAGENNRRFVELVSGTAKLPKGNKKATVYGDEYQKTSAKAKYEDVFGVNPSAYGNAADLLTAVLATAGIPMDFQNGTMTVDTTTYYNTDRYTFELRGDFPVFNSLMAQAQDCQRVVDKWILYDVDYNRTTGTYTPNYISVRLLYESSNIANTNCRVSNQDWSLSGDKMIYTNYTLSLK